MKFRISLYKYLYLSEIFIMNANISHFDKRLRSFSIAEVPKFLFLRPLFQYLHV